VCDEAGQGRLEVLVARREVLLTDAVVQVGGRVVVPAGFESGSVEVVGEAGLPEV
jgi:hypothetical protein